LAAYTKDETHAAIIGYTLAPCGPKATADFMGVADLRKFT
jgi:hypothetical protein